MNEVNRIFKALGMSTTHIQEPKRPHTVTVSNGAWNGLAQLAAEQGLNTWKGGNVSALCEAIGRGLYHLERKQDWELDNTD